VRGKVGAGENCSPYYLRTGIGLPWPSGDSSYTRYRDRVQGCPDWYQALYKGKGIRSKLVSGPVWG
jgi:hypothetical protein